MSRKRLVKDIKGTFQWVECFDYTVKNKPGKEDLTIEGHIDKYGSIHSHADDKRHTTKHSYMESLKEKQLVIKDW